MGLAALGVAQRLAARGRAGADEWLRRSERHLDLVGATGDAQSVRVLLDVQRALTGDAEARRRLDGTLTDVHADPVDAAQAALGLSQLAWQEQRLDDVLTGLAAVIRLADGPSYVVPQARVVARSAAATLSLRVAAARATAAPSGTDERAAGLLRLARDEALSILDTPVLGSCALAAAELAAHRGEVDAARELAALGARLGANVVYQFQDGPSERLAAALAGAPAPDRWRDEPLAAAIARVRERLDHLLGPGS
jgi:hypothetical protein